MRAVKRNPRGEEFIYFESDGWFERLVMEYLCQHNLTAKFSTAYDGRMKVALSNLEHVDRCLKYINANNPLVQEFIEEEKKRSRVNAISFLQAYNNMNLQ